MTFERRAKTGMPGRFGRGPLVFAHRGFHVQERENTLPALEAAVVAEADGVEIDVRATRDGELIVHHDEAIRIGARRDLIARLPASALPLWVPRVADVLARVRSHPELLIDLELKVPGLEHELIRSVRHHSLARRAIVTSFDAGILRAVRAESPQQPLGLISKEKAPAILEIATNARATHLVLHRSNASSGLVERAATAGLSVFAWGVDRRPAARILLERGICGFITDRPDRLRRLHT